MMGGEIGRDFPENKLLMEALRDRVGDAVDGHFVWNFADEIGIKIGPVRGPIITDHCGQPAVFGQEFGKTPGR